jgi:UDP-N-acetyl-D-galactosamine dehydrogenase
VDHALGVNTLDVLAAAGTKWNFLPFRPGLVGGHCIGVDPYYLTYRAEKAGCHPEVILAGRRTNDAVGPRVARECIRRLLADGRANPVVTILGLTFKEDVPDIRNSKVVDIITELKNFGITVQAHDPMASAEEVHHEFGIDLVETADLKPSDAVILAVSHKAYMEEGWPLIQKLLKPGNPIVMDVKGALPRATRPAGLAVWSL